MKIISKNKKINMNYKIVKKKEVGLVLTGIEVKTIREFGIDILNSYVIFKNNELFLINSIISMKSTNNINNFKDNSPNRTRKLLANKIEIKKWLLYKNKNNFAVMPYMVYLKKNIFKLEIAFCIGRKKVDKRQYLKEKAIKKEMRN